MIKLLLQFNSDLAFIQSECLRLTSPGCTMTDYALHGFIIRRHQFRHFHE